MPGAYPRPAVFGEREAGFGLSVSFVLTFWHRPLPAMISAFTTAGFRIAAIDEPLPAPDTPRELLPDFLKDKPPGTGFLCFMFFVLEAEPDESQLEKV